MNFPRVEQRAIAIANQRGTSNGLRRWEDDDSEQKRKNLTHKEVLENDSLGFSELRLSDQGEVFRDLRPGHRFHWRFTPGTTGKRPLEVYVDRVRSDAAQMLDRLVGVRELPSALQREVVPMAENAKRELEAFLAEKRWTPALVVLRDRPFTEGA